MVCTAIFGHVRVKKQRGSLGFDLFPRRGLRRSACLSSLAMCPGGDLQAEDLIVEQFRQQECVFNGCLSWFLSWFLLSDSAIQFRLFIPEKEFHGISLYNSVGWLVFLTDEPTIFPVSYSRISNGF